MNAATERQAQAWLENEYTRKMPSETMSFSPAEMVVAFKAGWSQRGFTLTGAPDPSEPGPYGIGSDVWPGLGKLVEEVSELNVELAKLLGSGGHREHWTGDLVVKLRSEIADVRAALDFFEEQNPVLTDEEHLGLGMSGAQFMAKRREWKLELFRSWQQDDDEEDWPTPEAFGLPARGAQ